MKFAALALVGVAVAKRGTGRAYSGNGRNHTASGRFQEDELIENFRVTYLADAVAKMMGLEA